MNDDTRNILLLMKETSYKTGTCERLNRVEVKSQKGKENRYRVGRYRDMKNYNNASELGCFRMQSAFPLLSHFVLVATSSEKAMAPYSSTLAWRIPGTAEPGRLPVYGVAQNRTQLKRLSSSSSSSRNCLELEEPLQFTQEGKET